MKKGLGKLLFRTKRSKSIDIDSNKKSEERLRKDIIVNDTIYKPIYQPYHAPSSNENRESTGSCSIYSTFGRDSLEEIDSQKEIKKDNTIQVTSEEEDNETVTTTDEEGEDQTFVDATGSFQEEIKKEKTSARLSKRLSGGHFGSAGGLMLSIMVSEDQSSNPPPEDIAESMINWKRQSGQIINKLIIEEDDNDVELFVGKEEDEARECAKKLWHEDETFVQREKIAEWLGQSKSLNASALNEYMSYFDFKTMRIDNSFRKVCSKLYFRAEAQQIDRILEAFAQRYWECNPKTVFRNADTVYAIVYSLLLLNTDLHVAQGNYTRMTRQTFIRNTMSTIKDQPANKKESFTPAWETHIESYLKDLYISVKHNQILHPLSQQQVGNDLLNPLNEMTSATRRLSIMGTKRMNDFKRNINTIMNKSPARESVFFQDDPTPRKSTSSANKPRSPYATLRSPRRESFSSTHSTTSSNQCLPSNSKSTADGRPLTPPGTSRHFDDSLLDRPPYYKEGVVMRKQLLESANHKAKHREWRECLLVVGHGQLKMHGIHSDSNNDLLTSPSILMRAGGASFANLSDTLTRQSQSSYSVVPKSSVSTSSSSGSVDNRWAVFTQPLGSIRLNHSLSNPLPPPGYNRQRPFVFAIQEPNGGVFLFQTKSQEQTLEWVTTCNYWAARESKEPLQGGIGNIEYGWGSCLDLESDKGTHNPDAVHISTWVPPAPTMVSSSLNEISQYDALRKYLDSLNEEINQHGDIKYKMLTKFPPKSQNHSKVLSNWEAKSKEEYF
ncbi:hypothetical protein G6F43_003740 [Rhizopus delemar]|nr:hypothetical protein G6F43_003740 [Rhizopus delemar]